MAKISQEVSPKSQSPAKNVPMAQAASGYMQVAGDVGMAAAAAGVGALAAMQGAVEAVNDLINSVNEANNTSFAKCAGEKLLNTPDTVKESDGSYDWYDCTGCAPGPLRKFIGDENDPEKESDKAGADLVLEKFTALLDLVAELSQPADLAGCINPYWQKFFSIVPYQMIMMYYIRKILSDLLSSRINYEEDIKETLKETACGTELEKIIRRSQNIEEFSLDFDLFKLPPIPLFKRPNLMQIINKIIVDFICYQACCILTPTLTNFTAIILEYVEKITEDAENRFGPSVDVESSLNSAAIKKINLKNWISDGAIIAAIEQEKVAYSQIKIEDKLVGAQYTTETKHLGYNKVLKEILGPKPKDVIVYKYQQGVWKDPSAEEVELAQAAIVQLIKGPGGYFDKIYEYSKSYKKKVYISGATDKKPAVDKDGKTIPGKFTTSKPAYAIHDFQRELGTKELLYLMMGETNCEILGDILAVSKDAAYADVLNLSDEDKILEFFQFLFNYVDVLEVITTLKDVDCPIDPCSLEDEGVKSEVTATLNNLCSLLNPAVGIPAIPMDFLASQMGISAMINAGIKKQFSFLKQKYYDFLGNPPYCKCGSKYLSGPLFAPFVAPNQKSFELYNSLYVRLRPLLLKEGIKDTDFDKFYGNFAQHVLFRGTLPGKADGCLKKGPVIPFWPYDSVDFKFGGTLDEECTDEPFIDTFNLIFKKGFDITRDDMNSIGEYIAEIQPKLITIEQNISKERANRKKTPSDEPTGLVNPCCKLANYDIGWSNPDPPNMAITKIFQQVAYTGADYPEIYEDLMGLTPEDRCWICKNEAMMYEIEDDVDEEWGNWDEELGALFRIFLDCEEFGLPTYTARKDTDKEIVSEFQDLAKGQGAEGWKDIQKRVKDKQAPNVLKGKTQSQYGPKVKYVTGPDGKPNTLAVLANTECKEGK